MNSIALQFNKTGTEALYEPHHFLCILLTSGIGVDDLELDAVDVEVSQLVELDMLDI